MDGQYAPSRLSGGNATGSSMFSYRGSLQTDNHPTSFPKPPSTPPPPAPASPPCAQFKSMCKVLQLYIEPRRIIIFSGFPLLFPANLASPRNPCNCDIHSAPRCSGRRDPSSEPERAEVVLVRVHAQRLAEGRPGGLKSALGTEGFRIRIQGCLTVDSPWVGVDVCARVGEVG